MATSGITLAEHVEAQLDQLQVFSQSMPLGKSIPQEMLDAALRAIDDGAEAIKAEQDELCAIAHFYEKDKEQKLFREMNIDTTTTTTTSEQPRNTAYALATTVNDTKCVIDACISDITQFVSDAHDEYELRKSKRKRKTVLPHTQTILPHTPWKERLARERRQMLRTIALTVLWCVLFFMTTNAGFLWLSALLVIIAVMVLYGGLARF